MSFGSYDFTETLRGEGIGREQVKRVVAAWGEAGDYNEWSGGFLLELKDGRYCYLSGWCDTTGWGCQDGTSSRYFESEPDIGSLEPSRDGIEWETTLPDLARFIETGEGEWS